MTVAATTTPFRSVAGRFATGVTVLSAVNEGQPFGMTANSFATVSVDPLLVLVCIASGARIHDRILESGSFAVTVLSAGQEATARRFADKSRPAGAAAFEDDAWAPGPATGCPVLLEGAAYFDCLVKDAHPAGDHSIFVGEVHAFDALPGRQPLVFAGGTFVPTTYAFPTLETPI